ncbi:NAD(P)/FAD-dependent oxidoreductase [Cellulomonas sp. ACRRI]|uniref:NAD(P)-binding domain-containing protein n=1 Tax=Cellulomonas sp. ACRRI TaxID=2918188 RepID=UPI001EF19BA5|nr:NAD(P)-binding domain-containing protein [Cellulomonas sp. ACRRI]MCG7286249.1 NAD(P)/FAD-dependent oxidoreductase [Cellulomonas sp. ACRRI]
MPDQIPNAALADVVVVGAGQAGLAVAAHLARSGFVPASPTSAGAADGGRGSTDGGPPTYVVLDAAAGPGGAWRERWPGLTMRTVNGVYELPGRPVPAFDADEPASRALTRYFGSYERDLGLAVRRPVEVRRVRDVGGPQRLLAVETEETERVPVPAPDPDDGLGGGAGGRRAEASTARRRVRRTWHTRALVNATGTWTRPFWPTYPGAGSFGGIQRHTHDYRSPEEFAGRRVLVVGGGISAVQHLLAIHPVAASTTWVTRRPPDWRDASFTPELGREAVARVDERTRAGLPPQSIVAATGLPLTDQYRDGIARGVLVARPMFARLVPDGAEWDAAAAAGPLADGWVTGPAHVTADAVLWATGFRAALDHLRPLGLRGTGGGIVMDGTRVVADPRVQLVGYGPSASTVGANRAARQTPR